MRSSKYTYEILTKALDIINRYEDSKGSVIIASDVKLFEYLNIFMGHLKNHINADYSPNQKQHEIDTFQILTQIAFDKLEKDVMGVN